MLKLLVFLTSIISWGNRKSIINSAHKMMDIMDNSPYDFVINSNNSEINKIQFVHRTFNSIDLQFFILSLKNIYKDYDSLEDVFIDNKNDFMFDGISKFRKIFSLLIIKKRSQKHISNPLKNSCCKRINMFLRWMVREMMKMLILEFGIK